MTTAYITVSLALIGSIFGSFAMAQVWRLRARQLANAKEQGAAYDKSEYRSLKHLLNSPVSKDRSVCLHCKYQLRWFDLIPIYSWLSLRGRCRKCRTPIGLYELIAELALATLFALSYLFFPLPLSSPLDWLHLTTWLLLLAALMVLFIYDLRWSLLPDLPLLVAGILAAIYVALGWTNINFLNLITALAILSGIYLFLYLFSKGKWVGSGDYLLAIPIALILPHPMLAFFVLFFANLLGCFLVIPSLFAGKRSFNSSVPLGPLLITALILVFFAQDLLLKIILP